MNQTIDTQCLFYPTISNIDYGMSLSIRSINGYIDRLRIISSIVPNATNIIDDDHLLAEFNRLSDGVETYTIYANVPAMSVAFVIGQFDKQNTIELTFGSISKGNS
jgi:hypothetical protein